MTQEKTADYEIRDLERRAADLQKKGLLTGVRDELEDLDTSLSQLPARMEEARAKGYVFKSYLEEQIASLGTQWRPMRGRLQRERRSRIVIRPKRPRPRPLRTAPGFGSRRCRASRGYRHDWR